MISFGNRSTSKLRSDHVGLISIGILQVAPVESMSLTVIYFCRLRTVLFLLLTLKLSRVRIYLQ